MALPAIVQRDSRGDTCEQDTRPCASNPCANGANCTNEGDNYMCHCSAVFSGKNCDQGFRCNRLPCKNGGSCQEKKDGSAICLCSPGYTGPDCSQDVDECASSPCQNGGFCVNATGNLHMQLFFQHTRWKALRTGVG